MPDSTPDLWGRRVLTAGGTGRVGEGVVRAYLAAGADVVVPTGSQERADEFRRLLGDAATGRLHLVVHDYTTFAGAESLAATMEDRLGGVDDVVAPIGAGGPANGCGRSAKATGRARSSSSRRSQAAPTRPSSAPPRLRRSPPAGW